MKSYTDLEQSKKLAEILPLHSADMKYTYYGFGQYGITAVFGEPIEFRFSGGKDIPCWSLAALLEVLNFAKCDIHKDIYGWKCYTWPNNWKYDSNWNDNPIDACYEMMLKLYKQKLL